MGNAARERVTSGREHLTIAIADRLSQQVVVAGQGLGHLVRSLLPEGAVEPSTSVNRNVTALLGTSPHPAPSHPMPRRA